MVKALHDAAEDFGRKRFHISQPTDFTRIRGTGGGVMWHLKAGHSIPGWWLASREMTKQVSSTASKVTTIVVVTPIPTIWNTLYGETLTGYLHIRAPSFSINIFNIAWKLLA